MRDTDALEEHPPKLVYGEVASAWDSPPVIIGAHVIIYTTDAEADRSFFRDVLGFESVDAGGGWVIFKLPPAELAMHPAEIGGGHELFLMCTTCTRRWST